MFSLPSESTSSAEYWEAFPASQELAASKIASIATPAPPANLLARIVGNLNPEEATDDSVLRDIHRRLQTWGNTNPERMVSVYHRNLVLWAVVKSIDAALKSEGSDDA